MIRQYVSGLALVGLFALPTLASSQANSQQNRYLICQEPTGSSTYLPGGLVPADRAGTVHDSFSGVLSLTITAGPDANLLEATWIRESSIVSTIDPAEGAKIRSGYSDPEIKRFDIDWQRGSSATILIKGLGSGAPFVAYADIKAGFGLDKVSSFATGCAEFTSAAEADKALSDALMDVSVQEIVKQAAARAAEEAVDATVSAPNAASTPAEPKLARKRK
jgi:hypothetical protein